MAAQQRIMQQADGLATLKELLASVQNPKLITEAHETYRKEIALTEAEQIKADEARKYIAEYDKLSQELKEKHEILSAARIDHDRKVTEFTNMSQAETKRLADFSDNLQAASSLQTASEKQRIEDYKKWEEIKNNTERQHTEIQKRLAKAQADIEQKQMENSEKEKQLNELSLTLKKRIEALKLREQAADILG